ncbi:MAG: hypothetical protein WBD27_04440 [Pyrinomonadaceae bacterium]
MQTEITQTIFQKVPMLSEDDQKKVLETVESLLDEKSLNKVKPISAIFEELSNQIPLEEWQELPIDGAENHDHYLYGAPRKNG